MIGVTVSRYLTLLKQTHKNVYINSINGISDMRKFLQFSMCVLLFTNLPSFAQGVCPKGRLILNLEKEYNEVWSQAELYQRAGMGQEYAAERRKLLSFDEKFLKLYLEQEIQNFSLTRDTRCLAAVYSEFVGMKVQFQARTDKKWNVFVSDVQTQAGLSDDELLALVKKVR